LTLTPTGKTLRMTGTSKTKIYGLQRLNYWTIKEEKIETCIALLRSTHLIYPVRASISCTRVEVFTVALHAP
jgi:hypothetical protein